MVYWKSGWTAMVIEIVKLEQLSKKLKLSVSHAR